jgi:uncharacterized membrane protein
MKPRGNPSDWPHRLPVAVLALLGCGVATYLTLYQWRVTPTVWDPLFGPHSSEAVLTSATARLLPVPDATLGALAYMVEAIATLIGNADRWRSAPWLVVLYGIVLAGLALTSLALTLTQILLVHAFCTLCLCSAAISLINAWLGHKEVLAAIGGVSPRGRHPHEGAYERTYR